MPEGEGKPPIPPDQMGLPKPEAATGQAPTGGDVVVRGDAATHDAAAHYGYATTRDAAAAQEQPSIDKLKAKLFGREVPEEYRKLVAQAASLFISQGSPYSMRFLHDVSSGYVPSGPSPREREEYMGRCFREEKLTELGKKLANEIKGKTVIDLGAGDASMVEDISFRLGATRYIGVDTDYLPHEERVSKWHDIDAFRVSDDMLGFVSKVRAVGDIVYYIGGIESFRNTDDQREQSKEYCDALLKEMNRTMKVGDAVIIGRGTWAPFSFEKLGFKLAVQSESTDTDERTYVYVKEKDITHPSPLTLRSGS